MLQYDSTRRYACAYSPALRWITECRSAATKKCPAFKSFFERIMADKPERKKIAVVAAAHRMIRVMGAMMRSGAAYDANYKG